MATLGASAPAGSFHDAAAAAADEDVAAPGQPLADLLGLRQCLIVAVLPADHADDHAPMIGKESGSRNQADGNG